MKHESKQRSPRANLPRRFQRRDVGRPWHGRLQIAGRRIGRSLAGTLLGSAIVLLALLVFETATRSTAAAEKTIDLSVQAPDLLIQGEIQKEQLGNDMVVGDVSGDGVLDLLAGAHWWSAGGRNIIGRSYVFFGKPEWPSTLDLSQAGQSDWSFTGRGREARLGVAVATGDLNDDGIDDVIIGSLLADPEVPSDPPGELANAGAIYVMWGGDDKGGEIDFLNSEPDLLITGRSIRQENESDRLGTYLVTGDFNGDGKDDLAAAAVQRNDLGGRVYVFHGPLDAKPAIHLQFESADLEIDGVANKGHFGAAMAVGDVNADGLDDLAVVALAAEGGPTSGGAVHVFYGSTEAVTPTLATDADFTLLGYDDMRLGDSIRTGTCSCRGQTLLVEDLTGDGIDDLIVGADAKRVGAVALVAGPQSAGQLSLDTSPYLHLHGGVPSGQLGWSLAAGDLDGDQAPDLAISAPGTGPNGTVFGFRGPMMETGRITVTEASAQLVVLGKSSNDSGAGLNLAIADTDADGAPDLHLGFPDAAPLGRNSVGQIAVLRGPLIPSLFTPTPSNTPGPSPTPTPSQTPTPSASPIPSRTPTPSPSPSVDPSATLTETPTPEFTPTLPTSTSTSTPTIIPTTIGPIHMPFLARNAKRSFVVNRARFRLLNIP